jgi:hypothetical protein
LHQGGSVAAWHYGGCLSCDEYKYEFVDNRRVALGVRLRKKSRGVAFDQASGDWWTYPSLFSVAMVDRKAKLWV